MAETARTQAVTGPGADRYARQRPIPGWDQRRLGEVTMIVVGVGALGNEVAKNLALAGVGRLILCDLDTVSESNLSRTVLFSPADAAARRPKVVAAAAALERLAPGIVVEPRDGDLAAEVGLGELADAAAVLGCLDSHRSRLRLLGRCALVEAPLVDGGTSPWGGEVRLRLSVQDPCYGCSLTPAQRGEPDEPRSCDDDDPALRPAAASIVSTTIVAGWMALLALRVAFGEPPTTRFIRVDGLTAQTAPVVVARDQRCTHHRPLGAATPSAASDCSTVAELLSSLPAGAVPLTWGSFPVPVTCRACGARLRPPPARPHAQVDGRRQLERASVMPCARCGRTVRLRNAQELTAAERGLRLRDLGVAPEEVLTVSMPKGGYEWLRLSARQQGSSPPGRRRVATRPSSR